MARQRITDQQVIDEHKKRLSEGDIATSLGSSQAAISMRMKKLSLKPWFKINPIDREIRDIRLLYSISGNPGTGKEIRQRSGLDCYHFIKGIARLREQNKVSSVFMNVSSHGAVAYRGRECVDGIAGLTVYYALGDEPLLGVYIIRHLPREIPIGLRKSLSHKLKHLPEDAFDVIRDYLDKHTIY